MIASIDATSAGRAAGVAGVLTVLVPDAVELVAVEPRAAANWGADSRTTAQGSSRVRSVARPMMRSPVRLVAKVRCSRANWYAVDPGFGLQVPERIESLRGPTGDRFT